MAFHVLMRTQQYFQYLTPSHNIIHHQGAGQQEELCTIIPGYHPRPANMELIYFWSLQIFLQRMEAGSGTRWREVSSLFCTF